MTDVARLVDEENPWPGLAAFDEASERFFNGRGAETAEVRRLVLQAPLTVLFGASGLGKTSLLQAGVFPLLRNDGVLPVRVRLDVVDRTAPLLDQLARALQREIESRQVDAPPFDAGESLWHYLHRPNLELWSAQNKLLTPLFVLDQFEEVFTLGGDNAAAISRLRTDLADLVENRIPASVTAMSRDGDGVGSELSLDSQRYKVLLSFREDFLPMLEGWKNDAPSIMRHRFRLVPMTGEQAFDAVHRTAPWLAGEQMAHQVVRFVAAARQTDGAGAVEQVSDLTVEPALLSLVCHGLNERRKAQGKRTFDEALLAQGGLSIVAEFYSESLRGLPDGVGRFIERELITERGYRKACDVDDARTAHGVTGAELRTLVDRRLLRIEPHRGTDRVELTHDLLTPIVRQHRERQRERERVQRYRKRMAAMTSLGLALLALVVVFFVLFRKADEQRRIAEYQARISGVQRLASQAAVALARSPQQSVLLAVEALHSSLIRGEPTVTAAEQSLRQALASVTGVAFGGAGTHAYASAISPDERWIAVNTGTAVYVLDLSSHEPPRFTLLGPVELRKDVTPTEAAGYTRISFSRNSQFVVATGQSAPHVWDMSRQPPARVQLPPAPGGAVAASMMSNDSESLFGVRQDGSLVHWALAESGQPATAAEISIDDVRVLDPRGQSLLEKGQDARRVFGTAFVDPSYVQLLSFNPRERSLVATEANLPAISADGRWAVVKGEGYTVCLLDLRTAAVCDAARFLAGVASNELPEIMFSADSRRLVIADRGVARVWTLTGSNPLTTVRELRRPHEGDTSTTGAALSPNGKWLLTSSLANTLDNNRRGGSTAWLWDLEADDPGLSARGLAAPEGVYAIAITNVFAIAGVESGIIRLWNVAEAGPDDSSRSKAGERPLELRGHERAVFHLAVSGSGRWLVSQGIDGSTRTWDLRSPHSAASPVQIAGTSILRISPDGQWLVRGMREGQVEVIDLRARGSIIAPEAIPNTRSTSSLAFHFSPDGRWLVVSDEYQSSVLVELSAGNPASASWTLADTENPAFVVFSRDKRWLALASKPDRVSQASEVRVWPLDRTPPGAPLIIRDVKHGITSLEFGPRGRWLLASTYSDPKSHAMLWSLPKLTAPNGSASVAGQPLSSTRGRFMPDGNGIVSSGGNEWVRFWDVSGDVAKLQREVSSPIKSDAMHISPDGRWMLTSGGGMYLWDLRRAGTVSPYPLRADEPSYPGPVVHFTPDGKRLVTTHADGVVRVWNLDESDPTARPVLLKGFSAPGAVAISANGRWLAATARRPISGPPDPTVRLLDLTAANPAATSFALLGHEGLPNLVFSSDQRWLVTGSTDDTLRFWDLGAADPSAAPMALPAFAPVTALFTDAGGRFVVSTHDDGFGRLWPLNVAELLAVAQTVAGRNLSQQEWKRFFQQEPYRQTFTTLPAATETDR